MRATYHVGEDFLDISDGLRAIDEAIHFLELRPGDRLGHTLNTYRVQPRTAKLCQLYHFNFTAKCEAAKITTFHVSNAYIGLMSKLQRAMQDFVNTCEISVECNPSSNVLIGTFGHYQNHPVLRFNRTGLSHTEDDPQMHISINSDDPGVFDTSLTFEYDLLAAAMADLTDVAGNRLYSDQKIREYLQNLIHMGHGTFLGSASIHENPPTFLQTPLHYAKINPSGFVFFELYREEVQV